MKRRMTKQRQIIYNTLMSQETHPNAYQIYDLVKREIPDISLGTVYRNLNLLVEDGLIRRLDLNDDNVRFDGNIEDHHHFVCQKCGKIIDIKDDYSFDLKKTENHYGVKIITTQMIFQGLCSVCVNKNEEDELWN